MTFQANQDLFFVHSFLTGHFRAFIFLYIIIMLAALLWILNSCLPSTLQYHNTPLVMLSRLENQPMHRLTSTLPDKHSKHPYLQAGNAL